MTSDAIAATPTKAAARTAGEIGAAAATRYLRVHSNSIKTGSESGVHSNPTVIVLLAFATGVILGRSVIR